MKKVMGVIGYPVQHSLSPQMHNAIYEALNLNMEYHAFEVHPNLLESAIHGVKGLGLLGVNVTLPHKVAVIPFLDDVDELALEIGAVNTIVNINGHLKGYNTDGEGYLTSLLEVIDSDIRKKRALVIGAGGAARAVSITLAKHGVKEMVIANRTEQKGKELATTCNKFSSTSFLSLKEAEEELDKFDLIINTTPLGMPPNENEMPIDLRKLQAKTFVSDLIYTPLKTTFLNEAEKKGANIQGGLDMLVYQGALAFELWTGKKAPIDVMRKAVLTSLKGGI